MITDHLSIGARLLALIQRGFSRDIRDVDNLAILSLALVWRTLSLNASLLTPTAILKSPARVAGPGTAAALATAATARTTGTVKRMVIKDDVQEMFLGSSEERLSRRCLELDLLRDDVASLLKIGSTYIHIHDQLPIATPALPAQL